MTTWILVSDASRAKLFSTELREDAWSLVEEFVHPEGREMSRDISPSSPPGRMRQSKAPGGRQTAVEPRTTPKESGAVRFAQQLANYLEDAIAKRELDYLVLVAPPHFLGTLHGTLGPQTVKHLRTTVDKDLSMFEPAKIRERLVDSVFQFKPRAP
jgi:protein required for attachment to host cells